MKRILITFGLICGLGLANAQTASFKDTEKLYSNAPVRKVIVTPQVNGFNCYTADLHVHTIFSDGELAPSERVKEAWIDGLDILAITDHIETRRQERSMLKFLKGYSPNKEGFEPINTRCSRGIPADERGIVSDLNYSTKLAREAAEGYPGLTIIMGTEISREPVKLGHYCALFTTDNNVLYSTDDAQTIRNARAQGALITHNHPGWERTSTDYTEFEKKIYAEGLIDGIEVTNGSSFYPKMVQRAIDEKLYVVSATDIHATTSSIFGNKPFFRDMTLILSKDKSEAALKEALKARRTLGYCGGNIIGEEALLGEFFRASVSAKFICESKKGNVVELANSTSFDYSIRVNDRIYAIPALGSTTVVVKGETVPAKVLNMIHVDFQNPTIELTIIK